ncbi:alcohol dehydrogenase [Aneurinibacillus thermoaerophilus]|uniref:Alcohol dehydrogenase n=1 Tax=Aneurinibacillus thermoaerophilus TaxID=143495 RepID=A0A1G7XAF9_ANETH|nr:MULTISPECIES: iron-containing alcohol dehydrogenase [Aneurinibacillus]AMA73279.1 L-threonine dehydrogenase [Aneurinibacillus sp. XH2]MED0678300.1 iron-containing alcohol dehydrogenase [Aneurinibacillus thermoaerophilus]MED0765813.1 iron-containing alcohol dehydrogenase [Aneurinibacillus thermoaerophilus]QYY44157.1 iron-containing alcohol dehydrogenase [Aneurinibacillus thermoaerophilus]SDG81114.1 alcohol dehydrogenase [Aneurinibacillus thermoaerophilus]
MENQVFGFYMPAVNIMGIGAAKEIGERMKSYGKKKALIVTDAGLYQFGVADQMAAYVEEAGLQAAIFPGAEPNPTDKNVEAGLAMYREEHCDCIISLGGGSSHDCAKGIGLVAANGGRIHDYEGVDRSQSPMVPLFAVNTTSGTASEMTRFCIITDTSRSVKMAIVDKHVTPTISINDPMLTVKKPPALTAATGMDALTHAVEAYVSTAATPITDACALQAIRLISRNLRVAVANGENLQARENMSYAQFLAGMAFNNASLGYVHAIAHQFGGVYNLPHGVCNAILLPHVERFNLISRAERFADIAEAMGENISGLSMREAAEKAIEAIETLARDVGIPRGFAELGAKEEDIELLAVNAMKDACALTNPRKATLEDIKEIIRAAF